MPKQRGWDPSDESDEVIYGVCSRFLDELGMLHDPHSAPADGHRHGAARAVAQWAQQRWKRDDLTRERVYPMFWEAARRNFLFLLPPRELHLAEQIAAKFNLDQYGENNEIIQVVNVQGPDAAAHVAAAGADLVLSLIERLAERKRGKPVHIGLGAGFATLVVAKRLAALVRSKIGFPDLVVHALSAGGFLADEPQKAPITYFSYFEDSLVNVEYVALFSQTFVSSQEDFDKVKKSPGVAKSFQRAEEIDIVITSLAGARHGHGVLVKLLKWLIDDGALAPDVLERMAQAGWKGDVQFRPYSSSGPMLDECPVRAVTLFELPDLVRMARTEGKYVVLLGGPCGECATPKTPALRPLLAEPELRLWTHLLTDAQTAKELLEEPPGGGKRKAES